MHLEDLNEYALAQIFFFLREKDLIALSCVSRSLNYLVNRYLQPIIHKRLMVRDVTRTTRNFLPITRLKIHQNWINGIYEEKVLYRHKPMYFSHIVLERDELLKSQGGEIRRYQRFKKSGRLSDRPMSVFRTRNQEDITFFAKRDGMIFAGQSNGYCLTIDMEQGVQEEYRVHENCAFINCVDFVEDVFVSASKAGAKLMIQEEELGITSLETRSSYPIVFQTARIREDKTKVAAGKYHDREKRSLCLIDVETESLETLHSTTSAIYDLLWKDETSILTANFDSTLRLADMRSGGDVQMWRDIYDSSIYCLDFDGAYGVVCGLKHFRVILYDLRAPNRFVQMYFPRRTNFNSSPVYSLACDASQLFVVTDSNLRVLNFNSEWGKKRDYSNMNIY